MIKYYVAVMFIFFTSFTYPQKENEDYSKDLKHETKKEDNAEKRKTPKLRSEEKTDSKESKLTDKYKDKYTDNYFRIDSSNRTLWNGKHWKPEDFPLKVYIDNNAEKYFKEVFRNYTNYALSIWQKSDERINFIFSQNENEADILIVFEENLMKKYDENYLGLTNYELDDDKKIEKAIIEISLLKYEDERVSDGEIKTTIIHELGHAIGLGHSSNIVDIMFPFIDPYSSVEMNFDELSLGDTMAARSVIDLGYERSYSAKAYEKY